MDLILIDSNYDNIYKPIKEYDKILAKYHMTIVSGVDKTYPFLNWVKDNEPWNLEGETITTSIKKGFGVDTISVMELIIGEDIIVDGNNLYLNFFGDKTENLSEGVYFYDINVNNIPYIGGKIFISRKITDNNG